jgi:hypothetical protein
MRERTIEDQRSKGLAILDSIVEFDSVPQEAKNYLAERVARAIRAAQEGGFQQAIDIYGDVARPKPRRTGIFADGLPVVGIPYMG